MDYDGTEEDVFDKEINFISIGRQVTAVTCLPCLLYTSDAADE